MEMCVITINKCSVRGMSSR